jgi:hypothetical protein
MYSYKRDDDFTVGFGLECRVEILTQVEVVVDFAVDCENDLTI